MRRPPMLAVAAGLAALAAGCGSAANSTTDFSGEEEKVAQVVEDLEEAAGKDRPKKVCEDLLAADVVRKLGSGCRDAVEKAFDSADTFTLDVKDVTIDGTTARARVAAGQDGDQVDVYELVRQGEDWRLRSFGSG